MKISPFDKLNEGLQAYRISHVIFTAFEIGIFSQLAKKSLTGRCYSYQEINNLLLKSGFRIGKKYQLTAASLLIEGIKN